MQNIRGNNVGEMRFDGPAQQLLERHLLQPGFLRDRFVQLLHVCRMMLAVMHLQSLLVEVRLERIVSVGQVGKAERVLLAADFV
jgi:hypothetical protein